MIKRMRELNNALPELLLGILLFGVVAQAVGVWFVPDRQMYSMGLWIGIAAAAGMAVHMAWVISDVTDHMTEKQARARAILHSILRYAAVAVLFVIATLSGAAYPLALLLGVLSLKAAAYLQPTLYKITNRKG